MAHIERWFILILIDHTMHLGCQGAYRKMVYFDSNRPYHASWLSRRISQDGLF